MPDVPDDPDTPDPGGTGALPLSAGGRGITPAAGPLTPLFRAALRNLVTDTLSPRRFVGVEDVLFADLHRLVAVVGPVVAGWKVWDALGVTVRPDFAEFWALRLESLVDKEAVAAAVSRELLALVQPLVEGAGAMAGAVESAKPAVPRDPGWEKAAHEFIAENPTCASCGGREFLQVHHRVPVHWPGGKALEMKRSNWMVLCEKPSRNCHLWDGHSGDFKSMNPDAEADAARNLAKIRNRPYPPHADAPPESARAAEGG